MKSTLLSAAVALAMGLGAAGLHAGQGQTTNQPNVPTTGNTVDDDVDRSRESNDPSTQNTGINRQNNEANRDMNRPNSREANPTTSREMNRNMDRDDMNRDPIDVEDFIETASAKGHAEIETARMALENGSPELHAFANRMIEDHSAANAELRQIAQRAGVEMADDPTLMDRARAMILDVRDDSFDEAYINNQVDAHEDTIELFERASQSDNTHIRQFAQDKLPTLKEHLRMANELKAQHDRRS